MIRRPPRSTLFPTRRSSDLLAERCLNPRPLFLFEMFLVNQQLPLLDRKSTRLNSSHSSISYAVFCLKKKKILHYKYSPHIHSINTTNTHIHRRRLGSLVRVD